MTLSSALLMSSCNVSRFLSAHQVLLTKETVVVEGEFKGGENTRLKEGLVYLTNTVPFKREAVYSYFKNQGKIDSAGGVKRFFYNIISQEPVYFDSAQIEKTKNNLTNYLKKEGYFDAEVRYTTSIKGKYGKVEYTAIPKQQYFFRDVTYEIREPEISIFLSDSWNKSVLKRGKVVSDLNYQLEKNRISDILFNNGYYFFDPSLIGPLIADSIGHEVNVAFRMNETDDRKVVQRYKIGRVNIHSDFDQNYSKLYNLDTTINNYRFLQISPKFRVKPSTILRYIYLKSGDYYSKANFTRTYRQLNRLGLFRYINVNQTIDDIDTTLLNVDLYLPPAKTLDISYNLDFGYVNLRTSAVAIPATILGQVGASVIKRNLFNGGEALRTNASAGYETSFNKAVNRIDLKLHNSLSFPRFMDFLGIVSGLKRVKTSKGPLLPKSFIETLEDRVTTNITMDFEYNNFKDWYKYYNLNGSYGFDVIQDNEHQYRWNHLGINYFKPTVFSLYSQVLENNYFLKQSFENPRLFTGLLFRDLSFIYKTADDNYGQNRKFYVNAELSGFEINLINRLINPSTNWKLFDNVEFSKFFKIYTEVSSTKVLFGRVLGAAKIGLGVSHSFGSSTTVPYLKQFEIGGPFSLRAFPIRKIGPGSYIDPVQQEKFPNGPYYQTGDMKIEYLSELRFPLFYIFKGAIFLDAGNIWSISKSDDNRPGSRFRFKDKPWNQLAVGTGVGLRLDLSFFVLRLDMGSALKYPYKINGSYNPYSSFKDRLRNLEYNLALNYPF
ncbi:MAG: BamA/TamA family outer membrane protein [Saprospiraceae bacterium]